MHTYIHYIEERGGGGSTPHCREPLLGWKINQKRVTIIFSSLLLDRIHRSKGEGE